MEYTRTWGAEFEPTINISSRGIEKLKFPHALLPKAIDRISPNRLDATVLRAGGIRRVTHNICSLSIRLHHSSTPTTDLDIRKAGRHHLVVMKQNCFNNVVNGSRIWMVLGALSAWGINGISGAAAAGPMDLCELAFSKSDIFLKSQPMAAGAFAQQVARYSPLPNSRHRFYYELLPSTWLGFDLFKRVLLKDRDSRRLAMRLIGTGVLFAGAAVSAIDGNRALVTTWDTVLRVIPPALIVVGLGIVLSADGLRGHENKVLDLVRWLDRDPRRPLLDAYEFPGIVVPETVRRGRSANTTGASRLFDDFATFVEGQTLPADSKGIDVTLRFFRRPSDPSELAPAADPEKHRFFLAIETH